MSSELQGLIEAAYPGLSYEQIRRVVNFHGFLTQENEKQNLTRLISPGDFFHGHLVDVMELAKTGWMVGKKLDLGSGCGVPGLLASLISGEQWILCDSEGSKARFLEEAAAFCGIADQIRVVSERAEKFLESESVDHVVARAVGPVLRVMGWIEACSTWNTLVLFKGPGWEAEWAELGQSRFRSKLRLASEHRYEVGQEKKARVLVRLERVSRRT